MTITRLRPYPSPEQLAAMYPRPHDHRIYGRGHHERVEATVALGLTIPERCRRVIGDLSCGNGEIARRISPPLGAELHLGDLAAGYEHCGPLEETIDLMPDVGTYVCSETIEHLDRPPIVLAQIRAKADWLLLSTPLECWEDTNAEHMFAWNRHDVEVMLLQAGWLPGAFASVDSREWGEPYLYGIWTCS